MMHALALLFADGRFPSGGHAHSGGIEAAVDDGRVSDQASLTSFLAGRLATAGRVAACLAAAACSGTSDLDRLDAEASARIASPALRAVSRQQGAALMRAASSVCKKGGRGPLSAHFAVAIGLVARDTGLAPVEAARWAAYDSVAGPASAAIRLLGLDPFATWGAVAALAPQIDLIAEQAPCGLAGCSAPLLDIGAERHAANGVTLFAS
ncbi:MAG: urease accessory protein UreF [Acidimicrobiales bacterium]